jgi:O-acetyl-ADP-ribose deacetylase (regulator of RNase III)
MLPSLCIRPPRELHGAMSVDPRIEIVDGDITAMDVDAVVNAANTFLRGGGGVDGAIHRAAGPELLEECKTIGGCPVGEACVTRGYALPARWVVHAVGPVWRGGRQGEDDVLASAYRNSLVAAVEHGARTVAVPLISTGAYGYPLERACRIAFREIDSFLALDTGLERVLVVCFGVAAYETCARVARGM